MVAIFQNGRKSISFYYRCNNYVAKLFFCFSAKHDVLGSLQALIGQILKLWCRLQSMTSCLGQGKPRVVEHYITVFNTRKGLTCQFRVFSNLCVTVFCVFWLNCYVWWRLMEWLGAGEWSFSISYSEKYLECILYYYEGILKLMCPWFVSTAAALNCLLYSIVPHSPAQPHLSHILLQCTQVGRGGKFSNPVAAQRGGIPGKQEKERERGGVPLDEKK